MCPDVVSQCAPSTPTLDPNVFVRQIIETYHGAIELAILFGAVCIIALIMLGLFMWVMRGD